MPENNEILVWDIETTHLIPTQGQIVEIAATYLRLGRNPIISCWFHSIVHESKYLDANAWIFQNTNLKVSDVLKAVNIDYWAPIIQKLLDSFPSVSWNTAFDFGWLRSRNFHESRLPDPMIVSTPFFKLPFPSGKPGYKWAKAEEAYRILFNEPDFREAHRSDQDTLIEARIINELWLRGVYRT